VFIASLTVLIYYHRVFQKSSTNQRNIGVIQVVLAVGEVVKPANVSVSITIFPILYIHYDAGSLGCLVPTEVRILDQGPDLNLVNITFLH